MNPNQQQPGKVVDLWRSGLTSACIVVLSAMAALLYHQSLLPKGQEVFLIVAMGAVLFGIIFLKSSATKPAQNDTQPEAQEGGDDGRPRSGVNIVGAAINLIIAVALIFGSFMIVQIIL